MLPYRYRDAQLLFFRFRRAVLTPHILLTSADSSQFVVTARRFFLASSARPLQLWTYSFHLMSARFTLDDSDSYWTLTSFAVLSSSLGLISGFCPSDQMFAAGFLQICSFQSHLSDKPRVRLAADTLAFGCNLPTIRAVGGLSPVRVRSCWTNKRRLHTEWYEAFL